MQSDWFGLARAWEKPSKAGMKKASSNVVADISLAWFGMSAEEGFQQLPFGLCAWPHCWLNTNKCKSLKHT